MLSILNGVFRLCKFGDESLKEAIKYQVRSFNETSTNDPGNLKKCKDDMGIDYLPYESIEKAWLGTAQKNGYHPICYMNSKLTREAICEKHFDEKWDAEKIAEHYKKDREEIQQVIDLLPKKEPLKKYIRQSICSQRSNNKTDEIIYETFQGVSVTKNVKLEEIKSTECGEKSEPL